MKDMKKILIGLSMCIVCFACTTKQDVIDGGVSSPYYDGTIMEYLRSNTEQWGYTVQMIERAGLTDLFEGSRYCTHNDFFCSAFFCRLPLFDGL